MTVLDVQDDQPETNFAKTTYKTDAQRGAMTRQIQDFREKQRAPAQNPFQSVDVEAMKDIAAGLEDDDLARQPVQIEPIP